MNDPFLFFLHIPKNAGTTLRSILDAQYGRRAVLTYYNQPSRQLLDNLRYMLMDQRNKYRALIGHYSLVATTIHGFGVRAREEVDGRTF